MDKTIGRRKKVVVTHDGRFHADDVFAVAALKIALNGNFRLIRTRDEKLISKGDFVVDVGRIYDQSKNKFDHHQFRGAGRRKNKVPYASFGLVWKKYGKKISSNQKVANDIEKKLVQSIDAYDNGFEILKTKKDFLPYTISDLISAWNPAWNENKSSLKFFKEAVSLAEKILRRIILRTKAKFQAEKFIQKAYKQSKDKRIILLERNLPWQEVIVKYKEPKFVVYPRDKTWCVRTVRKNDLSMESRKSFPQLWAGKTNGDLAKVSGVKDALFCHNNLFISTAKSRLGAIELAKKAL